MKHSFNKMLASGSIIAGSLIIRFVLNDHEPKPAKAAKRGAIK